MTTTELKRLLSKDKDLMMNCLRMTCLMMTTAETKRLWSKDLNKRDLSAAEAVRVSQGNAYSSRKNLHEDCSKVQKLLAS